MLWCKIRGKVFELVVFCEINATCREWLMKAEPSCSKKKPTIVSHSSMRVRQPCLLINISTRHVIKLKQLTIFLYHPPSISHFTRIQPCPLNMWWTGHFNKATNPKRLEWLPFVVLIPHAKQSPLIFISEIKIAVVGVIGF